MAAACPTFSRRILLRSKAVKSPRENQFLFLEVLEVRSIGYDHFEY